MDFFKTYFIDILKYKYADFSGRARRKEYWMFLLCYILAFMGLAIVGGILSALISEKIMILFAALIIILALGIIVPSIAMSVRRLHDTGKSGLFYLLVFVPFGSIVLLVFYIMEGDMGTNEYGPDPKEVEEEYI